MKKLKCPIARYNDEPIYITLPYGSKAFVEQYKKLGWDLTHHNGIDLVNSTNAQKAYGTPVYASQDGVVTRSIYDTSVSTKGNGLTIEGLPFYKGDKKILLITTYWHLADVSVKIGDFVKAGQIIGTLGNTGYAIGGHPSPFKGTHIHYMVFPYERVNGKWQKCEPNNGVGGAVNAELWLEDNWKEKAQTITYDKKVDIVNILGIIKRSIEYIKSKL